MLRAQDQTRALRKEWGTLSVERAGEEEERLEQPAKNPYLFRDTLLKMIEAANLEYKELTAKVA